MRERAEQLRSEPHHHEAGNDNRDRSAKSPQRPLAWIGAPRSTKMGTIASPFLYDALACRALRPSVPIATVPFAGPCCRATGIGHPEST
jgi:hypothetical protein